VGRRRENTIPRGRNRANRGKRKRPVSTTGRLAAKPFGKATGCSAETVKPWRSARRRAAPPIGEADVTGRIEVVPPLREEPRLERGRVGHDAVEEAPGPEERVRFPERRIEVGQVLECHVHGEDVDGSRPFAEELRHGGVDGNPEAPGHPGRLGGAPLVPEQREALPPVPLQVATVAAAVVEEHRARRVPSEVVVDDDITTRRSAACSEDFRACAG
jgi:hypothetical protein